MISNTDENSAVFCIDAITTIMAERIMNQKVDTDA
jgi:hypothetical protein